MGIWLGFQYQYDFFLEEHWVLSTNEELLVSLWVYMPPSHPSSCCAGHCCGSWTSQLGRIVLLLPSFESLQSAFWYYGGFPKEEVFISVLAQWHLGPVSVVNSVLIQNLRKKYYNSLTHSHLELKSNPSVLKLVNK